MMGNNKLIIDNVSFFQDGLPLFKPINSTLLNGEMLIVRGINGSGKTTLLQAIAGLIVPLQGKITWNKNNINECEEKPLHFIGHLNGLKPTLTVREQLELFLILQKVAGEKNLNAVLEVLGLLNFSNRPINELSQGLMRRVIFAKLLLIPKPLWILDEPLTSLDVETQLLIQQFMNQHREKDGIVIASSHQDLTGIQSTVSQITLS